MQVPGASHHITNKLSDYTSYTPYAIPEEVQTANKHDSLSILGEGTVFFDTETTNRQIQRVHLENVCYILNRSNRLLSRGQLCDTGLIERADNKSTIFSLPTGCIFLRGFPRHLTDTLHWVQSMIAHPSVPLAEPSVFYCQLQNMAFKNGISIQKHIKTHWDEHKWFYSKSNFSVR